MFALALRDMLFERSSRGFALAVPLFEVGAGERVFLQGASGSGKSTLLALSCGLLAPLQGEVYLAGQSLGAMSETARDQCRANEVGFIHQTLNLIPYLSVLDNVMLPARVSAKRRASAVDSHGSVAAHAQYLLTQLGLAEHTHARVTALSTGQQQRVAAARALLGAPSLILADEPTSALDRSNRDQFMDLLFAQISGSRSALVMVSHDESLASHFERKLPIESWVKASAHAGGQP